MKPFDLLLLDRLSSRFRRVRIGGAIRLLSYSDMVKNISIYHRLWHNRMETTWSAGVRVRPPKGSSHWSPNVFSSTGFFLWLHILYFSVFYTDNVVNPIGKCGGCLLYIHSWPLISCSFPAHYILIRAILYTWLNKHARQKNIFIVNGLHLCAMSAWDYRCFW